MAPGRARSQPLDQALAARRGSRRVALLADLADPPLELFRDVAALANSGGGVVVIGVDRGGLPTGWDPAALVRAGAAPLVEQLAAHLGERFEELEVSAAIKDGARLAAVQVGARSSSPLVFERAGGDVFGRGTVWFRHGARSEPARAGDLQRFAAREEARLRRELLRNVRHVASAPLGSHVLVVPPTSAPTSALERVRLVDDPGAPAVARADYDVTHPHRQKDVIALVNERLGRELVNAHAILSVRRVHDVDAREEWYHHPRFGTPQYTDAFVDWLVASYEQDHAFFDAAKAEYHRRQLARRAGQ